MVITKNEDTMRAFAEGIARAFNIIDNSGYAIDVFGEHTMKANEILKVTGYEIDYIYNEGTGLYMVRRMSNS